VPSRNFDGAIEQFRDAFELNSGELHTHYLGIALGQKGDLNTARAEFQQYIEKNPKDSAAHTNLAYALDQLNANYRGKGIGAQVVRETIATFGSHCRLIACKPFPLQYSNWEDEEHIETRQQPGIEEKRLANFARLARFWTDFGFVRT
jgi:tetratricopeptide (TPR) repeat protein